MKKGRSGAAIVPLPRVALWWFVAVAVATIAAYLPAVAAPFVMDDVVAIEDNVSITRLSPAPSVFSPPADSPISGRPVVNATLGLNYGLNELLKIDQRHDPGGPYKTVGYRLLNIFFHLLTGALLFGVLRRAMREQVVPADWRAIADPLAGIICAIWLLHPIQSEAINYVVQRTELLASLFYVSTLYASLRAWDATTGTARKLWYALGVLACVLGMGSKEIGISIALMVVLYDRAFRLPSWRALLRPGNGRGLFYVAMALASVISFAVLAIGARGQSAGFGTGMSWYGYFYTQCWAIAHYLRLALWPNALSVDYGTELVTGMRGVPGLLLLTALGIGVLIAWTKVSRFGWIAFAGSWFFILLAPSSSVVPIPTEIAAERRIYLALFAVIAVAVVGAEYLRRRAFQSISFKSLLGGLAVIAVLFALTTAFRSQVYTNPVLLWRSVVASAPGNPRGYVNLGSALLHSTPPNTAEAESTFRHAMTIDSTCHFGCAPLALLMAGDGRPADAERLYERTLAFDPGNAPVERRYAVLLMKEGLFDRAVPHLRRVADAFPTEEHLVVLGAAQVSVGLLRAGVATLQTAARLYPGNQTIARLIAAVQTNGGDAGAAAAMRQVALSLSAKWE